MAHKMNGTGHPPKPSWWMQSQTPAPRPRLCPWAAAGRGFALCMTALSRRGDCNGSQPACLASHLPFGWHSSCCPVSQATREQHVSPQPACVYKNTQKNCRSLPLAAEWRRSAAAAAPWPVPRAARLAALRPGGGWTPPACKRRAKAIRTPGHCDWPHARDLREPISGGGALQNQTRLDCMLRR